MNTSNICPDNLSEIESVVPEIWLVKVKSRGLVYLRRRIYSALYGTLWNFFRGISSTFSMRNLVKEGSHVDKSSSCMSRVWQRHKDPRWRLKYYHAWRQNEYILPGGSLNCLISAGNLTISHSLYVNIYNAQVLINCWRETGWLRAALFPALYINSCIKPINIKFALHHILGKCWSS